MIWKRKRKLKPMEFSTIKLRFENQFCDSLTCYSVKGILADTDKVHSGSSGNRSASVLPAKQPLPQPLPSYEMLAGLRQHVKMMVKQGEKKKQR